MANNTSSKPLQKDKFILMTVILILLVVTCQFASDNYLPSLPAITAYFNTTSSWSQLTITAYFVGLSFSQVFYGVMSDRFGRRSMLTLGLIIFFIGSLVCAFAGSIQAIIIGRLIQGAGIGAILALLRPMLCDCFAGEKLAQIGSYFGTIISITPALAPIAGGYIQAHYGWRFNFYLLSSLGVIILIITFLFIPETLSERNLESLKLMELKKNSLQLLLNKVFMGYAFCAGLAFSGVIAYSAISPYLFQNIYRLSPVAYGWLALYTSLSLAVGAFINGKLVKHFKILPMLTCGLFFTFIAGLSMFLLNFFGYKSVTAVLIPTMVYFFGIGFIMSNVFAGAFSEFRHIAGLAGSIYGSLQMFIAFIASTVVAALAHYTELELSLIYLALASTMIIIVWGITKKRKT